jgi:glycosyltransferase involved in cell wall biosynthesis
LNVAGMSRRKGHELLLDALADLRHRGIPFRAVLVGDGEERGRIEAHAAALGLREPEVHFAGALGQDAVPLEYRNADVFCLPSYAEGVPTVLMEAMASELPVVGTHIMGVPELIEHERSGLLVPPARADALADALARLAQDPELRARLGRAARERVEREFELRRAAAGVGAAIERAVAG